MSAVNVLMQILTGDTTLIQLAMHILRSACLKLSLEPE